MKELGSLGVEDEVAKAFAITTAWVMLERPLHHYGVKEIFGYIGGLFAVLTSLGIDGYN